MMSWNLYGAYLDVYFCLSGLSVTVTGWPAYNQLSGCLQMSRLKPKVDHRNSCVYFTAVGGLATLLTALCTSSPAQAECDFQKPIGGCQARITIDSTSGSKGSYSAEVTVRSSAPSCSKVEYFIDNTPHTTVLKNKNSEEESLFGTEKITKRSIDVRNCTAYANTQDNGQTNGHASNGAEFFRGHWTGSAGILLFRGPVEVTIERIDGDRATGFTFFPGDGTTEQVDGVIRNGTLSYSYTDLEHMKITLTKKGPNTISYRGVGEGGTVTGTLTRR